MTHRVKTILPIKYSNMLKVSLKEYVAHCENHGIDTPCSHRCEITQLTTNSDTVVMENSETIEFCGLAIQFALEHVKYASRIVDESVRIKESLDILQELFESLGKRKFIISWEEF